MNPRAIFMVIHLFFLMGCTSENSSGGRFDQVGSVATKAAVGAPEPCSSEDIATFDRPLGEPIDLEREVLPSGLYLATVSDLLVEKKTVTNTASSTARLLVREVPGGKSAEIVCSENAERLNEEFELSLTGLVKFDTSINPQGSGLTVRQFYFFNGKGGHGAMLSNPRILKPAYDVRGFLSRDGFLGHLVRLSERSYLLRSYVEREGLRARLQIRLELIQ